GPRPLEGRDADVEVGEEFFDLGDDAVLLLRWRNWQQRGPNDTVADVCLSPSLALFDEMSADALEIVEDVFGIDLRWKEDPAHGLIRGRVHREYPELADSCSVECDAKSSLGEDL